MNAHTFTPDRTHFLGVIMGSLVAVLVIAWAPLKLGGILLLPLLSVYWLWRAKTTVSSAGIDITYAFRRSRHIAWEDFAGLGFKGARAFAQTSTPPEKPAQLILPGITFNSLPQLAAASNGRIPDVLTAGRIAADEKVVVIHRDGEQILLSKEEFAEYKRTHPHLESKPGIH